MKKLITALIFSLSFATAASAQFPGVKNLKKAADKVEKKVDKEVKKEVKAVEKDVTAEVKEAVKVDLVTTALALKLTHFVAALEAAGLTEDFKSKPGPYTVFAPTDEAFEKAFKPSELKALLKDKDRIGKVLRSHIIDGDHASNHLAAGKVKSLQGNEVEIKTEGKVTFEGGEVTKADVAATNGRIHIINKIYLPK